MIGSIRVSVESNVSSVTVSVGSDSNHVSVGSNENIEVTVTTGLIQVSTISLGAIMALLGNFYTKAEINAFFEGISGGKMQVDWARITTKPTTMAGYGITDAFVQYDELLAEGVGGHTLSMYSADYSINQLIVQKNSGASITVKMGWSVGTDEIMKERTFYSTDRDTVLRGLAPPTDGDTTVYVTITGPGTANIYMQLLKYR